MGIDTRDREKIINDIKSLPVQNRMLLPSELAEKFRWMPRSVTEHPGNFSMDLTPYNKEPLDQLARDNPTKQVAIMKSVQSGATVAVAENFIFYVIYYLLGSVAYFTASKTTGKIRVSSAIDVMIDNTPLKDMVKPLSDRNARKTADTMLYKEIGISKLIISSYNSKADTKSHTIPYIIGDEVDEAPLEITGQGDTLARLEGRTMGVEKYKYLYLSTPSLEDNSQIYKKFLEGDQRKFFVPCPHCGEKQVFTLRFTGMDHGLTFKIVRDSFGNNIIDPKSIRYVCISCHKEILEIEKMKMLQGGEWVPTWQKTEYKPASPYHRSYHYSGLMSPFVSWERFLTEFKKTKFGKDIALFKNFKINYLGEPYSRTKKTLGWKALQDKAENYILGKPPTTIKHTLLLYGGADVQGNRIEVGIYGFYHMSEMWLIDYKVFHGNTADPTDACWSNLFDFVYRQTYKVNGKEINIRKCAIDSGWNPKIGRDKDWQSKANIVITFCTSTAGLFVPVKGIPNDRNNDANVIKLIRSSSAHTPRFTVNVDIAKDQFFNNIHVQEGAGAIHFPALQAEGIALDPHVYQSFLSEQLQEDDKGMFKWVKTYPRNEVLDTAVYAYSMYHLEGFHDKPLAWYKYLERSF